jgi:hypothetical protein
MSKSKSFKIGRNAETGRLMSVTDARKTPSKAVVEHIPKKGHGTAK